MASRRQDGEACRPEQVARQGEPDSAAGRAYEYPGGGHFCLVTCICICICVALRGPW